MAGDENRGELTSAVKASVLKSGALVKLKTVSHDVRNDAQDEIDALKQQAQSAIENIKKLLDSGMLDESTSQKLAAVLTKLTSVLSGDRPSRSALTIVLSEATSAIAGADANSKMLNLEQKTEQLWQRIEAANKDIDDDFKKMHEARLAFNEKLWKRHNELIEYLKEHPRDIQKQKELDAVDDALLLQAESQLKDHPAANQPFKDASDKSKERHEMVDKGFAAIRKREAESYDIAFSDIDSISLSDVRNTNNLTINDITLPTAGQKPKPNGKHHG